MQLSQCFTIKGFSKKDLELSVPGWQKMFPNYSVTYSSPFSCLEMVPNPSPKFFEDFFVYKNLITEAGVKFVLRDCPHDNFNFSTFILNDQLYISQSIYYYGQYTANILVNEIQKQITSSLLNDNKSPTYKDWSVAQARFGNVNAEPNYKVERDMLSKIGIEV